MDGSHQLPRRARCGLDGYLEVAGGPVARRVCSHHGDILIGTGFDCGALGDKSDDRFAGGVTGRHLGPELSVEVDVILVLLDLKLKTSGH